MSILQKLTGGRLRLPSLTQSSSRKLLVMDEQGGQLTPDESQLHVLVDESDDGYTPLTIRNDSTLTIPEDAELQRRPDGDGFIQAGGKTIQVELYQIVEDGGSREIPRELEGRTLQPVQRTRNEVLEILAN